MAAQVSILLSPEESLGGADSVTNIKKALFMGPKKAFQRGIQSLKTCLPGTGTFIARSAADDTSSHAHETATYNGISACSKLSFSSNGSGSGVNTSSTRSVQPQAGDAAASSLSLRYCGGSAPSPFYRSDSGCGSGCLPCHQQLTMLAATIEGLQYENCFLKRTVGDVQGQVADLWAVVSQMQQEQQEQRLTMMAAPSSVAATNPDDDEAATAADSNAACSSGADDVSNSCSLLLLSSASSSCHSAMTGMAADESSAIDCYDVSSTTACGTTDTCDSLDAIFTADAEEPTAASITVEAAAVVMDAEPATVAPDAAVASTAAPTTFHNTPTLSASSSAPRTSSSTGTGTSTSTSTSGSALLPPLQVWVPVLGQGQLPADEVTAIRQIHAPQWLGDSAVWQVQLGASQLLIVKVFPYYSADKAARVGEEVMQRGLVDEVPLRKNAMWEATVVADINSASAELDRQLLMRKQQQQQQQGTGAMPTPLGQDVYVAPLHVLDQEQSWPAAEQGEEEDGSYASSGECLWPDRKVVVIYPCLRAGNATEVMRREAVRLVLAAMMGELSLEAVPPVMGGSITKYAEALFALVDRMHELGYVLIDLKPENLVYCHRRERWFMVDAAGVRPCPLGQQLAGPSLCTPLYAAPEQRDGLWTDSKSDVFTAAFSVRMAYSDCAECFDSALGQDSEESLMAAAALGEALRPLGEAIAGCANEDVPDARPSAAVVLAKLRQLL